MVKIYIFVFVRNITLFVAVKKYASQHMRTHVYDKDPKLYVRLVRATRLR